MASLSFFEYLRNLIRIDSIRYDQIIKKTVMFIDRTAEIDRPGRGRSIVLINTVIISFLKRERTMNMFLKTFLKANHDSMNVPRPPKFLAAHSVWLTFSGRFKTIFIRRRSETVTKRSETNMNRSKTFIKTVTNGERLGTLDACYDT